MIQKWNMKNFVPNLRLHPTSEYYPHGDPIKMHIESNPTSTSFTAAQKKYSWVQKYLDTIACAQVEFNACKSFLESFSALQQGQFLEYSQRSLEEPTYAEEQFREMAQTLVNKFCISIEEKWESAYKALQAPKTSPTENDLSCLSNEFNLQIQQTIELRHHLAQIQPAVQIFRIQQSKKNALLHLEKDRKKFTEQLLAQTKKDKENLDGIREEYRRRKDAKSTEISINNAKISRLKQQIIQQYNAINQTLGGALVEAINSKDFFRNDLPIDLFSDKLSPTTPTKIPVADIHGQISSQKHTLRSAATASLGLLSSTPQGFQSSLSASNLTLAASARETKPAIDPIEPLLKDFANKKANNLKLIHDIAELQQTMDALLEVERSQCVLISELTEIASVLQTNTKKVETGKILEQEALREHQTPDLQQQTENHIIDDNVQSEAGFAPPPPPPPMPSIGFAPPPPPPPPPPMPTAAAFAAIPRPTVQRAINLTPVGETEISFQKTSTTKKPSMTPQEKPAYHKAIQESAAFQRRREQLVENSDDESETDDEWEEASPIKTTKKSAPPQFPPAILDDLKTYYQQELSVALATKSDFLKSKQDFTNAKDHIDTAIGHCKAFKTTMKQISEQVEVWGQEMEKRYMPANHHSVEQIEPLRVPNQKIPPKQSVIPSVSNPNIIATPLTSPAPILPSNPCETLAMRVLTQINQERTTSTTRLEDSLLEKLQRIEATSLSDARVIDIARLYCYKQNRENAIARLAISDEIRDIYQNSLEAFFDEAVDVCIDENISNQIRIASLKSLTDKHFPHRHALQRFIGDGLIALSGGVIGLIRKASGRSFFFSQASSDRKTDFCKQLETAVNNQNNQEPCIKPVF